MTRSSVMGTFRRESDDAGAGMATSLRVLLVGRPMYDPLYARLEEFG